MNSLDDLTRPDVLRLHLGGMTMRELRTAQAAMRFALSKVAAKLAQQDVTNNADIESIAAPFIGPYGYEGIELKGFASALLARAGKDGS